jgi:hypothetical protein
MNCDRDAKLKFDSEIQDNDTRTQEKINNVENENILLKKGLKLMFALIWLQ